MQNSSHTLYPSPFCAAYWRDAAAELKNIRTLVFSALMIAACVALAQIPSIPVGSTGARVTWGFLARSVCSMVGGPINALVFGLAEDTISFLLHPSGTYFPGYALTTMLGNFTYALFLYRSRVTVLRVALAKLLTNVQNVFLGSLWSYILTGGKTYWLYVAGRAVKNTVMFPIQTLILCVLFAALLPILNRVGLCRNKFSLR